MTILFYFHGGDALWLSLFWIVIVPILLIAGIFYLIYKVTDLSGEEKIKSVIYTPEEDDKNTKSLKR